MRAIALGLGATLAVEPVPAQTLRGHLLDAANGRPIDLGMVIMLSESGDSITSAITDERGYFSVTSPDPGSFRLLGWALGYGETKAGVFDLGMAGEVMVEFRLAAEPMPIDPILVALDRPVLEHALIRNGFLRRYQRGMGGHFLTPHDIERSSATTTEDLFAGLPGLTVRARGGLGAYLGDRVLMRGPAGGWCEPSLFMDGMRVRHDGDVGSLSSVVPLMDLAAVEVYRSPAEIPVEYNLTRSSSGSPAGPCGIIVLWTRQGR